MFERIPFRQIFLTCALAALTFFLLFFVLFDPSLAYATSHAAPTYAPGDGTSGGGIVQGIFETFSHGLSFVLAWVAILGLQWGIFIMAIFGVLLDLSLLLTFNMGAILAPGTSAGAAIAQAWTIFRDLANLMFIAGMVWVSIAMILQVQVPGGSVGKFIANIIIAALLVNFSFFFTGVIIDASNNISRLIYQEGVLNGESVLVGDTNINIGKLIEKVTGGVQLIDTSKEDVVSASFGFIGSQFVHQTKLSSIIDPETLSENISITQGNYTIILVAIVGGALVTATIQLFASLFFLIIGRFILLMILLALSPLIVFSIMGIPPFSEWGKHWWNSLMSQVIFLPVFVFLTAVSFRITNGFISTLGTGDVSIANIVGTPTGQEWNLALGLIITYIIAWGLLKQAKTISENIAQGKQVQLPSVEMVQGGLTEVGKRVGGFAERTATLPRQIGRAAVGQTLREVGNVPGVKQVRESLTEGVKATYKGGRALLDESYRYQYAREQQAKDESLKKIQDTQREIRDLEAAAAAASDPVERAKINQQVDAAKERLASQASSMHEALGASGMAKRMGDLTAEEQQAVLNSLDDEKAQEVYDELRKQGRLKASGKESDDKTDNTEVLKGMRKDMNRNQRIAAMQEKKYRDAVQEAIATAEGVDKYKEEGGPGTLGELPVGSIIDNNIVLDRLDDADMAVIKGREDITPEQYETIERQRETQQRRKGAPQPADLARENGDDDDGGDDGSSTRWVQRRQGKW